MAYDGFLGYINDEDPVSDNIKQCLDSFLVLPKEEQNLYFSMYENGIDYSERKDEFGKVIPYNLSDWVKTAVEYIKNCSDKDCENYALSKSVANINSIKITNEHKKAIAPIDDTPKEKYPIFTDEVTNRTVFSDGSIVDNNTGEEILSATFNSKITELNKEVTGDDTIKNNSDKLEFNRRLAIVDPDLFPEQRSKLEETELEEISEKEPTTPLVEKIEEVKADETIYVAKGRPDYLSWDEFFMGVAELAAKRSKDPKTRVGAVLVRNNRIISTGYNGMPYTKKVDNDQVYSWSKNEDAKLNKHSYVVHAELNAILNARQSVEGCTLYCTLLPCNECAKAIVQSGIKTVIYHDKKDKEIYDISLEMMENAGITLKKM